MSAKIEDLSSSQNGKKSLLHDSVVNILQRGMTEEIQNGHLSFYSKNINDINMPELCEWLVKLGDKVKSLISRLFSNQITSVGASMLFDTLKTNNSSMKFINFYFNREINDDCMKSLGEYIKANKSIERIDISYMSISDAGIEVLAPYLDGNTTFKHLFINNNTRITDRSVPFLVKMIESSHIEDMNIDATSITQPDIVFASLAVNQIKKSKSKLDFHRINDEILINICDTMKVYGIKNLKYLKSNSILSNTISPRGASILFNALRECNSVVSELGIAGNLNDESLKSFDEYIKNDEHLETLHLTKGNITDNNLEVLLKILIGNTTLKRLNLNDNGGITNASIPCILEVLRKTCITEIDLDDTSISEDMIQEIYDAQEISIDKREIPIKSTTKSAAKIQLSSASTST